MLVGPFISLSLVILISIIKVEESSSNKRKDNGRDIAKNISFSNSIQKVGHSRGQPFGWICGCESTD